MYSLKSLASLLPLASLGLALPVEPRDAPQFTITSLSAAFPYHGVYGQESVNSFVNIAITYPDASGAILNTTCRADWPVGVEPGPTSWAPCANPAVQWRLPADGWTYTTNFEVELWEQLTPDGAGLDASHILTSNPGQPSDPNAYMFCLQMGKFNPLTCTLTGPMGGPTTRTVIMPATEEPARPN